MEEVTYIAKAKQSFLQSIKGDQHIVPLEQLTLFLDKLLEQTTDEFKQILTEVTFERDPSVCPALPRDRSICF